MADATAHQGTTDARPVQSVRFDPGSAHPARVYCYWLDGKDHFPADRQAAQAVIRHRPQVVAGAQANRAFLGRVVRYLAADCGIRQFLDIGTGLPAPGATHQIAQELAPECRVVYVDNDPLVLVHARALLTAASPGKCSYIDADLRDTSTVLAQAARSLDFTRPAAALLLAVLHFIPDTDDPAAIVACLAAALAPGSYLVISHLTSDFAPDQVTAAVTAYNAAVPTTVVARTRPGQCPVRRAAAGATRGGSGHRMAPGRYRPSRPGGGSVRRSGPHSAPTGPRARGRPGMTGYPASEPTLADVAAQFLCWVCAPRASAACITQNTRPPACK